MGLNTWAAFAGTDADAMVAGDVAMLASEVTPVLKALRSNGINVVAIHHHMTGTSPTIFFLHYYGTGPRGEAGHRSARSGRSVGQAARRAYDEVRTQPGSVGRDPWAGGSRIPDPGSYAHIRLTT